MNCYWRQEIKHDERSTMGKGVNLRVPPTRLVICPTGGFKTGTWFLTEDWGVRGQSLPFGVRLTVWSECSTVQMRAGLTLPQLWPPGWRNQLGLSR